MNLLWCNGQWIDAIDFPASPSDRGVTVGLGLFETILAVDGEPVLPGRHLSRLHQGCERLGWQPVFPDLRDVIRGLLARNGLTGGRVRVRVTLSGGSGVLHDLSLGADARMWITAVQAAPVPTSVSAMLSPWPKNERSPLVGLKCTSYAENLAALAHATRLGFDETIFTNTSGRVCEASTANIFVVKGQRLVTPSLAAGCLPGITREVVIEAAARLGIPCDQSDVLPADLLAADECFLTSAIRGPVPVARIGQQPLRVGPLTATLRQAWESVIRGKIPAHGCFLY